MTLDLSTYVRVGRYDLPEPTRTSGPAGNLLGQESSGVTYNWDTNTLFVVGDGGTSVTQVSLTGQFIDTMTLPAGSSPQGTEFYDIEGITYVGGGQFVFTEERDRQVVKFTYEAGGTLTRAETQTVDLGTNIGNVGLEGLTFDPQTNGFVLVKEASPKGIFQTTIDFANGTASNGSSTTVNSIDLFDPALTGLSDHSDVYALSSNASFVGTSEQGNLLILSQESGKIVEVDRAGNILSSLTLQAPPTSSGISLAAMTVEGITMDAAGNIYLVSEEGGGDFDHPQLWVYAAASGSNEAPTAIALTGASTSILENSSTAVRLKVADIAVTDDGLGTNSFTVTGADAASFEADASGLYVKAGVVLDYETKASYSVTVNVDDAAVGATPDASTNYTLNVTNVVNEGATGSIIISEVAPWSSGNSPANVASDWFEITNTGATSIDLTGWKVDDSSYAFGSAVAMSGVASLAAGQSAIFLETTSASVVAAFRALWNVPETVQIGMYSGSGIGLSTGGDAVNVFDSVGTLKASVTFGASPSAAPFTTFDNSAGLNSTSLTTHVTISTMSAAGVNGAYAVDPAEGQEIGSPGSAGGVAAPVNAAPTAIALTGEITSLAETTSTAVRVKVASVGVTDDGLGTNTLAVTGADAAHFEVDGTGLYLKAGTALDFETKSHYDVTVTVDDASIGSTPDASVNFSLDLTDVAEVTVRITEVAPWSSGNSPVGADWFELTNTGTTTVDISGWKMDDSSNSFANAVTLNGITSIAPGESVIFLESSSAGISAAFLSNWFGANAPAGLQVGTYSGGGVGLSTGGDAVSVYDANGVLQANVSFGVSPSGPFPTFDNAAGLNNAAIPTLASVGTNGAFAAVNDGSEIGSPGAIADIVPTLTGTAARDTLTGGAGVEVIKGLAGNDTLNGLGGDDVLIGGLGSDQLNGGEGSDTASYASAASGVSVSLLANRGSFGEAVGDRLSSVENLAGSDFADVLTGSRGVNVIHGGGGADVIEGEGGADRLFGDGGDDIFVLQGIARPELIDGGSGLDTIRAGGDGTKIVGTVFTGIEAIDADGYDGVLIVGINGVADTIDLSSVTLSGIASIDGLGGDDTITGSAGSDVIDGGTGLDTIIGGEGNDTIIGGTAKDMLTGGSGADIFAFLRSDSGRTTLMADTITDFLSGDGDKIDLGGIDANIASVDADDAFSFIGNGAFSRSAGELRAETIGAETYVSGDTNGDGRADFVIHLSGALVLHQSDFIL